MSNTPRDNSRTSHDLALEHQRPPLTPYGEAFYRIRRRRAIATESAGRLRTVFRRGCGGLTQAWILPADAHAWFLEGLPFQRGGAL